MSKQNRISDAEDLPEIDEPTAAPDEWADVAPAEDHERLHREMDALTAEYLARGGRIHEVDPTVRAKKSEDFNREYGAHMESSKYTVAQFKQHKEKANRKANEKRDAQDLIVAKRITELLPLKLGKGEFLHHTGCSETTLQRVLLAHFADNEEALFYRKVSWIEREIEIVEKYRELRCRHAITTIAEMIHVRPDRLKAVLVKHGVRV